MTSEIKHNELYRIINRALSGCLNFEGNAVNKEIKIYCSRYIKKQNKKASDPVYELPQELLCAIRFCDDLEHYRGTTDIYSDKDETLSENQYRRIFSALNYYDAHIVSKNKKIKNILITSIKHHLPEFREDVLLDKYIEDAERIYKLKKNSDKTCRQKQQYAKDYEKEAMRLFRELFADEELHQIKSHPKKIELYEKSLKIVNCLPPERYGRVAKFKLKIDLNSAIQKTAALLGENYKPIADKAEREIKRYQRAIEQTQYYTENPTKKRKLSIEEYNRRKFEEWYYC